MDKFDRIQQLHRILISRRYPIPIADIASRLECTNKTARNAIDLLRDQLLAPLRYDESTRGWFYDHNSEAFELPGLWLTAGELHGLAAILHIIQNMGEGLLGEEITVVQQQLEKLLNAKQVPFEQFTRCIKYLSTGKRPVTSQHFAVIADALIHKQRLHIHYVDYSNKKSQRTISPQTLIHYQENWYLDAWCHKREALRSFMLPRVSKAIKVKASALAIDKAQLSEHYETSYGIFAGKPKHTAVLVFYPPVANEAAQINWHPNQVCEWVGQQYSVSIPYNDDRELIRDILKYGNNVEVLKPAVLKNKIKRIAQSMVDLYACY